jgi:hypothetical protein
MITLRRQGREASRSGRTTLPGMSTGRTLAMVVTSLLLQGCTVEEVLEVEISSVSVFPVTVNALAGEQVQLNATVVGEAGEALPGAWPKWTSDQPSIAAVDSLGVVTAYQEGLVTIRAAFRGAEGEATVRVLPGPQIELSTDSIALSAEFGSPSPDPELVYVTNGGNGKLSGLFVEVEYDGDAEAWLSAELNRKSTPAQITVAAASSGLATGTYGASVILRSSLAEVADRSLRVSLTVTGCRRVLPFLPCDWRSDTGGG